MIKSTDVDTKICIAFEHKYHKKSLEHIRLLQHKFSVKKLHCINIIIIFSANIQ